MTTSTLTKLLDKLSSKPIIRYLIYSSSTIFFFAIILIPPILGILLKWNLIGQIFENPDLMNTALSAIQASFAIAIFVSIIDVVLGLPMAWYIVRSKSRWLNIIDTLADIPFIVPTVTLGYSLRLFWSDPSQGVSSLFTTTIISPGWLLVILLHFAFSYPVVVRVIVGALYDYQLVYEEAARTLGAPPLTVDRTVTLPILKPSIISAFILAFARSLSETGATVMVADTFQNGPVFIHNNYDPLNPNYGPLIFVSSLLITTSCIIFAIIVVLGPKLRMPIKRVWPIAERKLSSHNVATLRNSITLIVFLFIVLIPSVYVAFPALNAIANGTFNEAISGVGIWGDYWQSLILSYSIGGIVTLLNLVVGLPLAILIARKRFGSLLSKILDILVNIPLIVPSIALGFSLRLFWTENFVGIPETALIVFAHLAITYPYFVRAMSAAVERVSVDFEDAARILGAKPFTVFRTVILPLTKYSLFSGAVMMFTRSVDETGATLAVTTLKTAPVLLVDWVKTFLSQNASPTTISSLDIGLGCGFLILFSFVVLLVLRLLVRGRGRY